MNDYVVKVVKECYVDISSKDCHEAISDVMSGCGYVSDEEIIDISIIEESVSDNYNIFIDDGEYYG